MSDKCFSQQWKQHNCYMLHYRIPIRASTLKLSAELYVKALFPESISFPAVWFNHKFQQWSFVCVLVLAWLIKRNERNLFCFFNRSYLRALVEPSGSRPGCARLCVFQGDCRVALPMWPEVSSMVRPVVCFSFLGAITQDENVLIGAIVHTLWAELA